MCQHLIEMGQLATSIVDSQACAAEPKQKCENAKWVGYVVGDLFCECIPKPAWKAFLLHDMDSIDAE